MTRVCGHIGEDEPLPIPGVVIQAHTLGACQIQVGAERLSPASETLFGLMVRLLYAPGMRISKGALMTMFWPDHSEARQRGNLRQSLYKLRQMGVQMDVHGEEIRLYQAQVVSTFSTARTIENFRRSVDHQGEPFGTFLPGYEARNADMREWVADTREVVHSEIRRVLVEELRGCRERVEWQRAESLCRWLLEFDPLNEDATLTLAECIAVSGGKAQALEVLDRYLEELGSGAGDIRIPAARLRRRLTDGGASRIPTEATERHFVGRSKELAQFLLVFRRIQWSGGCGSLLFGPAGIGKTRLTDEIEALAAMEGLLTIRCSCREGDRMRPLAVAMEMVSSLLRAPGALGCAPETLRMLQRLVAQEAVSGTGDSQPVSREPLPPPAIIRKAVIELVGVITHEIPVYLVLDDAHWLDLESWEVFADIMELASELRICVLATSRVPHACAEPPERNTPGLNIMELSPLTDEESLELAEKVAADLKFDTSGGLEEVIACCNGSPLFLHEMLLHYEAFGSDGRLPETISQSLQARLGLLSQLAFRAVQVVAKMQPMAYVSLIEKVLDVPIPALAEALDELAQAHLIRTDKRSNVSCHAMVASAALSSLSTPTSFMLHKRIAQALLAERKQGSTAWDLSIIQHFISAGEKDQALDHLLAALPTLKSTGAAHQLTVLMSTLTKAFPELRERPDVNEALRELLYISGKHSRLLELFTPENIDNPDEEWIITHPREWIHIASSIVYVDRSRIKDLLPRLTALARTPRVDLVNRSEAVACAIKLAADEAAIEHAREAYFIFNQIREDTGPVMSNRTDMLYHVTFGDRQLGLEAALSLRNQITQFPDTQIRLELLSNVAYAIRHCDSWEEGEKAFESVFREAERLEHHPIAALSAYHLSLIALNHKPDLSDALFWHNRLRQVVAECDEPFLQVLALHQSARVGLAVGDQSLVASTLDELRRQSAANLLSLKQKAYQAAIELASALYQRDSYSISLATDIALVYFTKVHFLIGSNFLFATVLEGLLWLRRTSDLEAAVQTVRKAIDGLAMPPRRLQLALQRAEIYLLQFRQRSET